MLPCLRVNINALESDDDDDTEEKTLFVDWGYEDAAKAAAAGHRDIVMGLYDNAGSDIRNDEEALKAVAASGDVTLVRWLLHVQRRTITPRKGMHEAAANGHHRETAGQMAVVCWTIDRDWSIDTSSDHESDEVTSFGSYFDDERPSRRHVTSWGGEASIQRAAVIGHLDVAVYLHARVDWPLDANNEDI
ncbi:hypothetical protein PC119_g23875 [Phytophthora cactorum]|nr:hypothetical protein PC119_g23875 [Phytophthora cactorum]